jgi:enterobactin synthetase component D
MAVPPFSLASASAWAWELDHGLCVGVKLPVEDEGALSPEERTRADDLAPARRRSWVGGRVALRAAASLRGIVLPSVGTDERGAPLLPSGLRGSISHKDDVAVALLAEGTQDGGHIGVDVERDVPRKTDVSRKVLRAEELAELEAMPWPLRRRELLLRFSAKEAVYKALDPFVQRYVGFLEVAARPSADGRVAIVTSLAKGEGPFHVEGRWRSEGDLLLTTARVVRCTGERG